MTIFLNYQETGGAGTVYGCASRKMIKGDDEAIAVFTITLVPIKDPTH